MATECTEVGSVISTGLSALMQTYLSSHNCTYNVRDLKPAVGLDTSHTADTEEESASVSASLELRSTITR
jgi:hypothetical protein